MTRPDLAALYRRAELSRCGHVTIGADELLPLLAELHRAAPVVRAAREWHLAKMNPMWLASAVEEYLAARKRAGADG